MRIADAQMFTIKGVHRSGRPQREIRKSDVIGVPGAELRKDRSGAR
jgi:hypothetical protein